MGCWLGIILLAAAGNIVSAENTNTNTEKQTTATPARSLRSRKLIIGGSTAPTDRFPYYVALKDSNREIQCGGTLIAPDIVLTAAHCRGSNLMYADVGKYSILEDDGHEEIRILNPLEMMGSWSTVGNLELSGAAIIDASGFIHPDHDLTLRTYDVMLMKLERSASSDRPLMKVNSDSAVPVKQAGGMNEITVIGMGNVDISGTAPKPNELKQVHVNYLPYEECIDAEGYNLDYKFELLPHMICSQGAGMYSDRGQCYGDSGGPYIIMGNTPEEDVQVGVVSWAVNCASSVFPMVGSRTSESLRFIKEVTCAMSANPPTDLCRAEINSIQDISIQTRLDVSNGVSVSVRVYSDPFGHELRWRITDKNDESKVYAEAPYGRIVGDHAFQQVMVPAGVDLKFRIDDAADDGIFGDANAVLYEIVLVDEGEGGELVMLEGNGQFGSSREDTFSVPRENEYMAIFQSRGSREDAATDRFASTGPTVPTFIYIKFDDYHEDASWKVTSLDGLTIYASKNANDYRYGDEVKEQVDLASGKYKFTISDRRGTDEYRAFQSYKLSYQNTQQRSGSGEISLYQSVGLFQGESQSHEFEIPSMGGSSGGGSAVVIDNASFADAQTQLCKASKTYCTSADACCSGVCQGFRCQGTTSSSSSSGSSSNGRDKMRTSISGSSGGAARGGF